MKQQGQASNSSGLGRIAPLPDSNPARGRPLCNRKKMMGRNVNPGLTEPYLIPVPKLNRPLISWTLEMGGFFMDGKVGHDATLRTLAAEFCDRGYGRTEGRRAPGPGRGRRRARASSCDGAAARAPEGRVLQEPVVAELRGVQAGPPRLHRSLEQEEEG